MRPYILAENNWKNISSVRYEVAVLPWGATEAHNYHLPYGTDILESEFIAAESAKIAWEKGAKIIVLPTIPFGVNTGQTDIYLDINMNPTTQLAILKDVITVMERQEIYKFLILNSHGGNDFKPLLRELGIMFPKMFLGTCNWFQAVEKKDFFEEEGDHADEMETSLLLYLKPDLVLPLSEAGDGKEKKINLYGFNENWAWTERKWSKVTLDTGIGNPKLANKEKGAAYFEAVTSKVSELMTSLANADLNNLYS